MSLGRLDLTGASDQNAADTVIDRVCALLAVDASRVILAASPDDARRACAAAGTPIRFDRSVEGVLGLEDELDPSGPTLIRIGPARAPLCAVIVEDEGARSLIAAQMSPPPPSLIEAGLDGLRPAARLKARADRDERDDLLAKAARQLAAIPAVSEAELDAEGLVLTIEPGGVDQLAAEFGLHGRNEDGQVKLSVATAAKARALVDWLGVDDQARTATIRRTTKETDIALTVNLDGQGGEISTGVHFFDHMLDQIARHGGIGLSVVCEGDVEVDAHHTIEDVCLALGEGLREALGDKRGIARFGFETPMDETRASVWIDLSGRPYARFDGEIPGERVGDFPIEMCSHAFRSLAESLRAAIHVKVDGENAHHMVESCFKSFGRALRMAKTIEGDALPSTKGVL
jgi:imidazoleglycerol phosphate dehydratase HisB